MEARSVGGQWLKEHYNLVNYTMTHCSYIADNPAIRVTAKGNIEQDYGIKYAVAIENNALHHVEFFLKYDDLNLDFLQAVFQRISAAEIEAFISESPAIWMVIVPIVRLSGKHGNWKTCWHET